MSTVFSAHVPITDETLKDLIRYDGISCPSEIYVDKDGQAHRVYELGLRSGGWTFLFYATEHYSNAESFNEFFANLNAELKDAGLGHVKVYGQYDNHDSPEESKEIHVWFSEITESKSGQKRHSEQPGSGEYFHMDQFGYDWRRYSVDIRFNN